ncbi:DUF1289 domain-containing protein [Aliikangiella sp. G2MR2-5]|uniref:DUF1289 domain-containing protein n=1 Tax=Aliikangiella sp. G2MR2-5 TaxID=2788943 RepID=UPI0018A89871|nr:DUF1289 domain-containing protein [Aliikangiella sp. G2MR2-5]
MNFDDPNFVQSPCISQCCLNEDDICVGCFRHIDEITGWHGATNEERKKIIQTCKLRKIENDKKFNG